MPKASERLLLASGRFLTLDPARPVVEAVLVMDGLIRWVGAIADAPAADRRIDLDGAVVIPGLTDAHLHLYARALERLEVDVGEGVDSIDALLSRLANAAAGKPGRAWIVAGSYNEQMLRERRHPSLSELDGAAGGRPVLIKRTGGHLAVANSAALAAAGWNDDSSDPPAGTLVREAGRLTGVLAERAADIAISLLPKPEARDVAAAIRRVCDDCLAFGIVAAVEAAVGFSSGFGAEWDVWQSLRQERLPLRMGFMLRIDPAGAAAAGLSPGAPDLRWQANTLKFFVDGIIGARTAALSEPFAGTDDTGLFMDEPEALQRKVIEGHAAGWQLAAHTIGDRAIDLWLDCLQAAERSRPSTGARHRIEHLALPSVEALKRVADAGIIAVPQYGFVRRLGDSFAAALGPRRANRLYPARSVLAAGATIAGSSDMPIGPLSPFIGMAAATDRRTASGACLGADERLTPLQALSIYATGGATAMGHEVHRGAIREGMAADLVVLDSDQDIFSRDTTVPENLRVRLTMVGGVVAYGGGVG